MTEISETHSPVERKLVHVRNIKLCGYQRGDELWDIEAQLVDTRAYDSCAIERGAIMAGESVHDMWVRLTVDDSLTVRAVASSMQAHPFQNCPGALPSLMALVGSVLGPGWRRQIETHLGGHKGCTHIREMLLQLATTAYQTIPVWYAQQAGDVMPVQDGKPPRHLGQCHGWAFDTPIVARFYPEFFREK